MKNSGIYCFKAILFLLLTLHCSWNDGLIYNYFSYKNQVKYLAYAIY